MSVNNKSKTKDCKKDLKQLFTHEEYIEVKKLINSTEAQDIKDIYTKLSTCSKEEESPLIREIKLKVLKTKKSNNNLFFLLLSHIKENYKLKNYHFLELFIYFYDFTENGFISKSNFITTNMTFLQSIKIDKLNKEERNTTGEKQIIKDLFKYLDVNNQKKLSLEAINNFLKELCKENVNLDIETVFNLIDKGNKKYFTVSDLEDFVTQFVDFINSAMEKIEDSDIDSQPFSEDVFDKLVTLIFDNDTNKQINDNDFIMDKKYKKNKSFKIILDLFTLTENIIRRIISDAIEQDGMGEDESILKEHRNIRMDYCYYDDSDDNNDINTNNILIFNRMDNEENTLLEADKNNNNSLKEDNVKKNVYPNAFGFDLKPTVVENDSDYISKSNSKEENNINKDYTEKNNDTLLEYKRRSSLENNDFTCRYIDKHSKNHIDLIEEEEEKSNKAGYNSEESNMKESEKDKKDSDNNIIQINFCNDHSYKYKEENEEILKRIAQKNSQIDLNHSVTSAEDNSIDSNNKKNTSLKKNSNQISIFNKCSNSNASYNIEIIGNSQINADGSNVDILYQQNKEATDYKTKSEYNKKHSSLKAKNIIDNNNKFNNSNDKFSNQTIHEINCYEGFNANNNISLINNDFCVNVNNKINSNPKAIGSNKIVSNTPSFHPSLARMISFGNDACINNNTNSNNYCNINCLSPNKVLSNAYYNNIIKSSKQRFSNSLCNACFKTNSYTYCVNINNNDYHNISSNVIDSTIKKIDHFFNANNNLNNTIDISPLNISDIALIEQLKLDTALYAIGFDNVVNYFNKIIRLKYNNKTNISLNSIEKDLQDLILKYTGNINNSIRIQALNKLLYLIYKNNYYCIAEYNRCTEENISIYSVFAYLFYLSKGNIKDKLLSITYLYGINNNESIKEFLFGFLSIYIDNTNSYSLSKYNNKTYMSKHTLIESLISSYKLKYKNININLYDLIFYIISIDITNVTSINTNDTMTYIDLKYYTYTDNIKEENEDKDEKHYNKINNASFKENQLNADNLVFKNIVVSSESKLIKEYNKYLDIVFNRNTKKNLNKSFINNNSLNSIETCFYSIISKNSKFYNKDLDKNYNQKDLNNNILDIIALTISNRKEKFNFFKNISIYTFYNILEQNSILGFINKFQLNKCFYRLFDFCNKEDNIYFKKQEVRLYKYHTINNIYFFI